MAKIKKKFIISFVAIALVIALAVAIPLIVVNTMIDHLRDGGSNFYKDPVDPLYFTKAEKIENLEGYKYRVERSSLSGVVVYKEGSGYGLYSLDKDSLL